MLASFKLPFIFDTEPLRREVETIPQTAWSRHFNAHYYDGAWDGVALRSIGGTIDRIYQDPRGGGKIVDTPILARCENLRQVLATFQCEIRLARLLRLSPGSSIKEHRDYYLGFEEGEVRLHIPITTDPEVEFFLAGRRVDMQPGECWYLDFSLSHRVSNQSRTDRIHLVLDCVLNDWLRQILSEVTSETDMATNPCECTKGGWQEFHDYVLTQPELLARLRSTDDRQTFIELAEAVGRENCYFFTKEHVDGAIQAARREWFTRWVN
ncbi:MAG: aspartyl/asparaginyl beta-hydroxylase domain-containing protein [Pyrinomonadaceae bacterium]